jgi:NADH-quinone oxidoreductase subunit F
VPLDFGQSRLGTGAMIVISKGTSIVRKVAEFVDFFRERLVRPMPAVQEWRRRGCVGRNGFAEGAGSEAGVGRLGVSL